MSSNALNTSSMLALAAEIGWHKHGHRRVWGLGPDDGCAVCDAGLAWLLAGSPDPWADSPPPPPPRKRTLSLGDRRITL